MHKARMRVFLESEEYGREVFKQTSSNEQVNKQIVKLVRDCIEAFKTDGIRRQVGIEIR